MGYKRVKNEKFEEQIAMGAKKFVKYDEGAKIMSMGIHSFMDLAKDAKAVYRIKRMVFVNMDIIYDYMENFKDDIGSDY